MIFGYERQDEIKGEYLKQWSVKDKPKDFCGRLFRL